MPNMKLNAEVLLRIEGHDELYNVGTIDIPINITFGDKPARPGMRDAGVHVKVDEGGLGYSLEAAVQRGLSKATSPVTRHLINATRQ